jgi:hypothetical protein
MKDMASNVRTVAKISENSFYNHAVDGMRFFRGVLGDSASLLRGHLNEGKFNARHNLLLLMICTPQR